MKQDILCKKVKQLAVLDLEQLHQMLSGLDMSRDMLNNIFGTGRGFTKFPTEVVQNSTFGGNAVGVGGRGHQPQKLR